MLQAERPLNHFTNLSLLLHAVKLLTHNNMLVTALPRHSTMCIDRLQPLGKYHIIAVTAPFYEMKRQALLSISPRSVSLSSGMTGRHINAMVINGDLRGQPALWMVS